MSYLTASIILEDHAISEEKRISTGRGSFDNNGNYRSFSRYRLNMRDRSFSRAKLNMRSRSFSRSKLNMRDRSISLYILKIIPTFTIKSTYRISIKP